MITLPSHQKRGQLASIAAVERALGDLERSVIITGVGLAQCESLRTILAGLRDSTEQAIPEQPPEASPKKTKSRKAVIGPIGIPMTAERLVRRMGKALIGRTVTTEKIGDYPGGPAKVIWIQPDTSAPEIVYRVLHPTFGKMGVFDRETATLID